MTEPIARRSFPDYFDVVFREQTAEMSEKIAS